MKFSFSFDIFDSPVAIGGRNLGMLCALLLTSPIVACSQDTPRDTLPASCQEKAVEEAPARLLTRSEYRRTTQDLLGTTLDATLGFPVEPMVGGFNNDQDSHQANPLLVEKHAAGAELLVKDLMTRGISSLYACDPSFSEKACALALVQDFGLRAFRRPLADREVSLFVRLYDQASPTLGNEEALAAVVEAMLQSPQFLYRVEAPISTTKDGRVLLGPYEMASRLSYFLWGTLPDDELFLAAKENRLSETSDIESQARRLLADEKSRARVDEFHQLWLGLDRLDSLSRDGLSRESAGALKESTLMFLRDIFWNNGAKIAEVFSSPSLFINPSLSEFYAQDVSLEGWQKIDQPETRSGLLTQPGILTMLSNGAQSSPIQRGVFVREGILCETVAPPPPSVNNNPPDPAPGLTTRERFLEHTAEPACASCHRLIDPMGFGFEAYDHLGRYRTKENELPIDTSGAIVSVKETKIEGPFSDAVELGQRLSQSDTVFTCLTKKWFTFAMGRPYSQNDSCSTDGAIQQGFARGGDMQEMLVALATSPAFRTRAAHESDTEAKK